MSNSYISVCENFKARTIKETFERIFSCPKPHPRRGYFKPLPLFTNTELEGCYIWFPKLEDEEKWENKLSKDGNEIISKSRIDDNKKGARSKEKAEVGRKNITFVRKKNEYIFVGIFELYQIKGNIDYWKKISDECPIFSKSNNRN